MTTQLATGIDLDADRADDAATAVAEPVDGHAAGPPDAASAATPPARVEPVAPRRRGTWLGRWVRGVIQRGERRLSRMAGRHPFWHRVLSWKFLPMAFRSGIRFEKGNVGTFEAVLPFRRFNRNWYNAMAGGALLGNAEIVGGMYVFNRCGVDYTVVCKELSYKFLRPCIGPAVYQCEAQEDLDALVAAGGEFNITLDMEVKQMVSPKDDRQRRVGKCTARFHVTPKSVWRDRKKRREKARFNA